MSLMLPARTAAALIFCALLAGCGGSVADTDATSPRATRELAAPPNAFCAASRANAEAIAPLNALVSTGGVDRGELTKAVEAVRRTGADLVLAAPADIREDVQTTVDAIDVQLDALLANGGDGRAVGRDPAVAARLSSPELAAANERLTGYVNRTCGAARR